MPDPPSRFDLIEGSSPTLRGIGWQDQHLILHDTAYATPSTMTMTHGQPTASAATSAFFAVVGGTFRPADPGNLSRYETTTATENTCYPFDKTPECGDMPRMTLRSIRWSDGETSVLYHGRPATAWAVDGKGKLWAWADDTHLAGSIAHTAWPQGHVPRVVAPLAEGVAVLTAKDDALFLVLASQNITVQALGEPSPALATLQDAQAAWTEDGLLVLGTRLADGRALLATPDGWRTASVDPSARWPLWTPGGTYLTTDAGVLRYVPVSQQAEPALAVEL